MEAAEAPASQWGEGTHPVHSNISWLTQGSAVCPSLEHGTVALGRLLGGLQHVAAWACGVQSLKLLIWSEE